MQKTCNRFLSIMAITAMVVALTLAFRQESVAVNVPQTPAAGITLKSLSQWDELVKAAQREGTVCVYAASSLAPAIGSLKEAFGRKFGIKLEFVTGRPSEVLAKVTTERRANLFLADVGHFGETTSMNVVKPLNVSVPLVNLLILPEVKNPKNWLSGQLPYLDKDREVISFLAMAIPHGIANSDLVKKDDISSFLDILKPQWKGKIVMTDPTLGSTPTNQMASLAKSLGKELALEILRKLAAQKPVIIRDPRLLTEWIARAKYPIGLGESMTIYNKFKKDGAPLRILELKEPRFVSAGPGAITVFSKNPHPNAAQLYVNWVLGAEGQSIWSKALGYPSKRKDVTTAHLKPYMIPRPDDVSLSEEFLELNMEMKKIAADIFGLK